MKNQKAKILFPEKIGKLCYPLPQSWIEAAGILKGKKIHPLRYQRKIRKEWDERLKKLSKAYQR